MDQKYAETLAKTIVKKSKKHGVPSKVLAAMLMQESAYKVSAKNIKCGISIETGKKDCIIVDYGIGQINHKTIKAFKFDQKKLLTDLSYSVEASAVVLATFKAKYMKSEPKTWYCRYNAGTGGLDRIGPICQKYIKLVARHF